MAFACEYLQRDLSRRNWTTLKRPTGFLSFPPLVLGLARLPSASVPESAVFRQGRLALE